MAENIQVEVPEIVDSVDALMAKMKAMRQAQQVFSTFTQEQHVNISNRNQYYLATPEPRSPITTSPG